MISRATPKCTSFPTTYCDAASAFEKFPADLRVEGTPSEVVIMRRDDGVEFTEGKFEHLCQERKIKQEFSTTSHTGSSVHNEVSFDSKGRGLFGEGVADVLPTCVTAFRMAPISILLYCTPGKQRDLLSTSSDRYVRLFLKDVRVLKKDGPKPLPK